MFHREGGVHSNIFREHRLEPEDGSFRMIYDVVAAAGLVLVELEVKFVRIGERNTNFPKHLYDLLAPVVNVARGGGGEIFSGHDVQLGDSVEIRGTLWVDVRSPTQREVRRPIRKSAKG